MTDEQLTFHPVGKSVPRIDALDKVTGAAQFTDDLQFGPGLLFGRAVRSPHPHARIIKVEPIGGDPGRRCEGNMGVGVSSIKLNAGKESICLELKSPKGREILGRTRLPPKPLQG